MIKVLHLTEQLSGIGGTPRKLLSLTRHSNREIISHNFLCFLAGDLDDQFRELGSSVAVVGSTSPAAIVAAVLRQIRCGNVDLVSTHFSRAFLCGQVVHMLTGVPLLHNEHGATLAIADRRFRERFVRIIKSLFLRRTGVIACNSAYTGRTLRELTGVKAQQIRVVLNPVEARGEVVASRGKISTERRAVVLGHVGGMVPVRDQATLVRAVGVLMQRGIEAKLIMVGDGPVRPELQRIVTELGLGARVEMGGYSVNVAQLFSEIDLYVNPAVAEGFGIAVVEAMLAGVPVVLADAGAHCELTKDGAFGVLFEPGNAEALADAIHLLWSDEKMRHSLIAAALIHAAQSYAPGRYVDAYTAVVRECLVRRNAGPG